MTAATLITLLQTNLAISGVIVDRLSEFSSTVFATVSSNNVVRELLWRASVSAVANPDVMELVTILFV